MKTSQIHDTLTRDIYTITQNATNRNILNIQNEIDMLNYTLIKLNDPETAQKSFDAHIKEVKASKDRLMNMTNAKLDDYNSLIEYLNINSEFFPTRIKQRLIMEYQALIDNLHQKSEESIVTLSKDEYILNQITTCSNRLKQKEDELTQLTSYQEEICSPLFIKETCPLIKMNANFLDDMEY